MKHDYFLMYKISNNSFKKYKGDAIRISEVIPTTYDEIWVGIKKHPEKTRRITTFRDEKGRIIERTFDYSDSKLRNRVYNHRTLKIGDKETVNTTTIKDYFINKQVLPFYNTMLEDYAESHPLKNILWNITNIITNHTSKNKDTGKIVLSQVKIHNMQTPTKEVHSFTEYPHIVNGKIQKTKNKALKFIVNHITGKIKNDSLEAQGVSIPYNDSYLAQRALPIEDAKSPFAERFIREHKLQKALIEINPDYYPKDEDEKLYAAHFDPLDGSINFNRFFKPYSKTRLVGIAKHETEHGWQYYLRSRFTEASTEWEEFIRERFGQLKNKALFKEAEKYTKSIKQYIALTKELESEGKTQEYRENYIEIMAKKAAQKTRIQYDKEGKAIRRSFKHIPQEYL